MAWTLVVLALLLLAYPATAQVVALTDATFAEQVLSTSDNNSTSSNSSLWFVDFYVDWCKWSLRLEPTWEELGADEELQQAGVRVGAVDCEAFKETCVKARVSEYPTLKVFSQGEFVDGYRGSLDLDCLKAFALGLHVGDNAAAIPAAITAVGNSTEVEDVEEVEEGMLRYHPRISVGSLRRMLLELFGL